MNNLKTLPTVSINDLYIKNGTQKKPLPKWLATVQTKVEDDPKYKEELINLLAGKIKKKKSKKYEQDKNDVTKKKEKIYIGAGQCPVKSEMYCLFCKKKTNNINKCDFYLSEKGTLRMETNCSVCNNTKSIFKNRDSLPEELVPKYNELMKKVKSV